MDKQGKLTLWQKRLEQNRSAWEDERKRMDEREKLYLGSHKLKPMVKLDEKTETPHVRNICSELVESCVDSNLPTPKVTARRECDEWRAKLIEDMLRNEMDRIPMEEINDMMERTVSIQGGGLYLVEWDNTLVTPRTVGELVISPIHPKQIVPQDGVTTSIEDMDFVILALPQTKEYIKRRYGVDVESESESDPDARGDESQSEDLVTQWRAYFRNDDGGIGLFSWVNDTVLEDLEDCQARRLRRCAECGMSDAKKDEDGQDVCTYCGSNRWTEAEEEEEEIYDPIRRSDGSVIPGARATVDEIEGETAEDGEPLLGPVLEPTRVPYYKPDVYPLVLQRNVSVYGRLLGDSDVDKVTDQQNTINRLSAKIVDKLMKSGDLVILPDDVSIDRTPTDMTVARPENAAAANLIRVEHMEGAITQDMEYLAQVYEESRQCIGITDSYQGRKDSTATSGKAKEFSAAQSAGRLESKRVMKNAAYSRLFELMFKFRLAYADEPRPVVSSDSHGDKVYNEFNRYDFLERDAEGDWYWNTDFIFSCDTSAALAANREAMWQETRMNLQTGAFGNPQELQTLILFWSRMEQLHYPGAGETRSYLEEELARQQEAMRQQAKLQAAKQEAARQAQVLNQLEREGELMDIPAAEEPQMPTPAQKLAGIPYQPTSGPIEPTE